MSPSNHHHRHSHSLSETLRGVNPGSPRSRRQPSLTQAAIQSLIDNPPVRNAPDPAFAGRDWRHISIGELVSPNDLKFVELDTGIEEATNILITSDVAVLLVRETPQDTAAVATFDYSDLNAYLLLASGYTQPDEEQLSWYNELARKAKEGTKIPLRDVKNLGKKEPLTKLPASANVLTAVEAFGGGIHRVMVVNENNPDEVVGIFSQFRLVKFLWENGRSFPVIERLYTQSIRDLCIGSQRVISINGDKPLCEALQLMNQEGVSSVAVIDNHFNVIGNISTADVKLLTRSTSLHLLRNTCIHFISVILSTRGLVEGKDSFPVFHVNPSSTLAHIVAKMVATRSHRLWVTDPLSPSSSGSPAPSHSAGNLPMPTASSTTPALASAPNYRPTSSSSNKALFSSPSPRPASPIGAPAAASQACTLTQAPIPASALPGSRLSGGLVGVVTLTDVLNLYARASGLSPADPAESRSRRRRSSSSSMSIRRSGELRRELLARYG